jgi:hypothetical protein
LIVSIDILIDSEMIAAERVCNVPKAGNKAGEQLWGEQQDEIPFPSRA